MKKSLRHKRGQGMTEYIIIVAIVAIGAILIVSLFGRQIKDVFSRITGTLGGTDAGGGDAATITSDSGTEASDKESMQQFDTGQNQ